MVLYQLQTFDIFDVYYSLKAQYICWNYQIFTWFLVYYSPNINGGWMGGPKCLYSVQ